MHCVIEIRHLYNIKYFMQNNSKYLIKRILLEFIKPYYKKLLLAVGFMVIVAATTAGQAAIMKPIIDKIFVDKNISFLLIISFSLFGIFVLRGFASYAQQVILQYVESYIVVDVQRKLFSKLLISDIAFFSKTSSGQIISHLTNDVGTLKASLSNSLTNLVRESLSLIFLLALIFYYIPKLALVTLFVFPLAIYPVYHLGKKMRNISKNTQIELGGFNNQIDEVAGGIRVIKAYNAEQIEKRKIFNLTERLKKLYKKAIRTNAITSPLTETIGGLAFAIVIYYGGKDVVAGKITSGTFFTFITAILSAYKPMKSLTKLNNQVQSGLAAAERIFSFLDQKPIIRDNKKAENLIIKKGNIKLEKVEFCYPNTEGKALKNISFEVSKGETVALIGKSGSGKSTIMNLLLRFYDPVGGKVTIDDHDIKEMSFKNLRSQIAYVSQDIFLFDDTIGNNIAYGVDRKVSKEELIKAAKQSESYEFIEKLAEGFETRIGTRGNLLSGGQKQRLALARAFLKNAPILLLDEATSALDPISEKKIQIALEKLKKNRTCLIIAHRLNTISDSDRILIVSGGEIVESGTHQELLEKSDYYKLLQISLEE